jgi:hypothetical protein
VWIAHVCEAVCVQLRHPAATGSRTTRQAMRDDRRLPRRGAAFALEGVADA